MSDQTVRESVESQKWDEDMEGFRIIALELPCADFRRASLRRLWPLY